MTEHETGKKQKRISVGGKKALLGVLLVIVVALLLSLVIRFTVLQ